MVIVVPDATESLKEAGDASAATCSTPALLNPACNMTVALAAVFGQPSEAESPDVFDVA